MKWLALTFGHETCASTRFRVLQYVPLLRELGIELVCRPAVELDDISNLDGFDGILVQKKLFRLSRLRRLAKFRLPVVFDIDDATWQPLEKKHHLFTRWRTLHRLQAILKLSRVSLPANEYIAAFLRRYNERAEVLPMTLSLSEWQVAQPSHGPVVIGWSGVPGNHFQLRRIEAALREVKHIMPEVIIRIFSGTNPQLDVKIDFVPFQMERQTEVPNSFSIGLLPLPDTPFSQGKSPIKALQYMAAGIPCVASPCAGTVEMLGEQGGALFAEDQQSWVNHLLNLARDDELRVRMGKLNRERFEACYTAEAVARRLAGILRQAAKLA